MKIRIIFTFFIILLINKITFSQELGSSLITNYTIDDYNAHVQNWSVVKDKRGVMYFANYSCILEYDGVNWRKIYVENNYAIRSLAIDDYGTIYVGGEGAFGYLAPDSLGSMQYNSISAKYDSTIIKTTPIIWRTRIVNNEVYFNALNVLYRYSPYKKDAKTDLDKIKVWYPKLNFYIGFSVFNKYYIVEKSRGLLEIINDSLVLAKNGEQFIKTAIFSMEPSYLEQNNNEIIIATKSKLFKYNLNADTTNGKSAISAFNTQIDTIYEANDNYCCLTLPEKKYAIGTISNGIIVIDSLGNICDVISKQNGLQDNTIWAFNYYDRCLWIAMNNGISKSEIVSPLRVWNDKNSLEGSITSITKFNNNLYITTNSLGTWYLPEKIYDGIIPKFLKLETISEAWALLNYYDKINNINFLLVGLFGSLIEIDKDNNITTVFKKSIYHLEQSKLNNDFVYAAGLNLNILKRNYLKKSWDVNNLYKFQSAISSIAEDKNCLWITTKLNGIYQIKFDSVEYFFSSNFDSAKIDITHYDTTTIGLKGKIDLKVYNYENNIIFGSKDGFYVFNEKNKSFELTDIMGVNFSNGLLGSTSFCQNQKGDFWAGDAGISYKQKDGSFLVDTMFTKRLPITLSAFYADSNQTWYAGGSKGLLQYNKKYDYDYNAEFNILIRKVYINNDSTIFNGTFFEKNEISGVNISTLNQNKELIPKIKYEFNTLFFEYAAPFFIEESKTLYSYKLENFDDNWSDWSSKTEKEYTNIPEGKYIFKVKAKNIFDKESNIANYEFEIIAPWYRTWWSYTIYLILSILLVYLIIKIYTKRLKEQNIKLEKIVEERTIEIKLKNIDLEQQKEEIQAQADNLIEANNQLYQQKEEIQAQADQLEKYNVELEKLSIVASQTDNAIMILDKYGNFEWVNDAFTRMFGYTFNELIKTFGENIKGNKTETWLIDLINDCIENKKTIEYELNILTKSNESVWIHTTLTPILDDYGNINKLVAIDSDIRKLKQAEIEIHKQRDILHFQNQQITASIRYAKTIQTAILPLESQISEHFEHFILFRPKDIVSGDFYMFISNTINEIEYFFVATVDCTGHGVPGAFMSMIASRIIIEIIKEKNIFSPKEILDELNVNIRKALKQEQSQNNDGMDLCLCRIEKLENSKAEITYTGAKRPLYFYKNGDTEISILKADRKSIGGRKSNIEQVQFTNQTIVLQKSDIIYLSTDGLIDQNNEERKRFGSSNFLRILNSNISKPLDIQKQSIENELDNWQKNSEQRDDITVLGLKI